MNDQKPKGDEGIGADLVSIFGYVLGISYPVLALSTSVRSLYQIFFKEGVTNYVPPSLSAIAAVCYIVACIGFLYRKKWAWRVSLITLIAETFFALVVGVLSLVIPDVIGRTVWANFGIDYGFFPFIQPLIGIVWLTWSQTLKEYGLIPKEGELSWSEAIKRAMSRQ